MANCFGHFTGAKEFRSQCRILRPPLRKPEKTRRRCRGGDMVFHDCGISDFVIFTTLSKNMKKRNLCFFLFQKLPGASGPPPSAQARFEPNCAPQISPGDQV